MNTMVLGIAGGTGSGKTTLTRRLKDRFGEQISVISHDNYYKRQDELTYEQRCLTNYDHPDAFETDLMVEHLKALKAGETVLCPVYDFSQHNRSDDFIQIHPAPVILVPTAVMGSPTVTCQGSPNITCSTHADGTMCTVTLTQQVCVSIPVRYGVTMSTCDPTISCADSCTGCGCC